MINHYMMVTNPQHGKKFESGFRKEIRKHQLKQSLKSILYIVGAIPCAFLFFFLSKPVQVFYFINKHFSLIPYYSQILKK